MGSRAAPHGPWRTQQGGRGSGRSRWGMARGAAWHAVRRLALQSRLSHPDMEEASSTS